jgi:hypothetical protein
LTYFCPLFDKKCQLSAHSTPRKQTIYKKTANKKSSTDMCARNKNNTAEEQQERRKRDRHSLWIAKMLSGAQELPYNLFLEMTISLSTRLSKADY